MQEEKAKLCFSSGSRVLFTGPACTLFTQQKKTLKLGLTVLFTRLKIILLQFFQFSAK